MPGTSNGFSIWGESDCAYWRSLLSSYPSAIAAQGNEKLTNLDRWYREDLPGIIAERDEPCLYLDELKCIAAWKMTRGVWRERNRVLISGNPPEEVEDASKRAFAAVPDPKTPVAILSSLAGVGPATASAALAAFAPASYPFFDEAVADQINGLGPVTFTLKYYLAYAQALRERARELSEKCDGAAFTPQDIAQAMWGAWASSAQSTTP
jgi:hypothetical protein